MGMGVVYFACMCYQGMREIVDLKMARDGFWEDEILHKRTMKP